MDGAPAPGPISAVPVLWIFARVDVPLECNPRGTCVPRVCVLGTRRTDPDAVSAAAGGELMERKK